MYKISKRNGKSEILGEAGETIKEKYGYHGYFNQQIGKTMQIFNSLFISNQ